MSIAEDNLYRLLNIGIALSAQRDMPKLLDIILNEAMEITRCDAGTLYLLEDNLLSFKIMRNHTMKTYQGGNGEEVDLPPVPLEETNVCAYVVIHGEMENIDDVYNSDAFDFSGPRNYDKITGYRTQSMMVIPLENNRGVTIGVLQLINATDGAGNVIAFDEQYEFIFRAVASQAAIAVTNMRYTENIKELLNSLAQVLAAAIDERSPYNANHTRNVAALTDEFIDFMNESHEAGKTHYFMDSALKQQTIMAAWLHDVGKIITPLEIMDKATRLGRDLVLVMLRFDTIFYLEETRFLKGDMTCDEWNALSAEIKTAKALCERSDSGAHLTDEEIAAIQSYGYRCASYEDGTQVIWLTPHEINCLSLKSGTLTDEERAIMKDHVLITKRLLEKIKFTEEYRDVPILASSHHEKLNGCGYPLGMKGDELSLPMRILGLMDVFEALTAIRPYKSSMPTKKALSIISKMTADGDFDPHLVSLLEDLKGVDEE